MTRPPMTNEDEDDQTECRMPVECGVEENQDEEDDEEFGVLREDAHPERRASGRDKFNNQVGQRNKSKTEGDEREENDSDSSSSSACCLALCWARYWAGMLAVQTSEVVWVLAAAAFSIFSYLSC